MPRHRSVLAPLVSLATAGLLLACAGCGASDATAPAVLLPAADATPPAPPTGLSASPAGTALKLGWEPNTTDADLAGYLVYQMFQGGACRLTPEPMPGTTWLVRTPPAGPCAYAVAAVDTDGNESAWCSTAWAGSPGLPQRADDR
ncbi:MAG: hypothetical protein ABR506_04725 [Candidatus Krumholzibacteriia bacterium]